MRGRNYGEWEALLLDRFHQMVPRDQELPEDLIKPTRIEKGSSKFVIHDEKLLCKFITNTDIPSVLTMLDAHKGRISLHGNPWGNVWQPHKYSNYGPQGYKIRLLWPLMLQDAQDLVMKCQICHLFTSFSYTVTIELIPIVNHVPSS